MPVDNAAHYDFEYSAPLVPARRSVVMRDDASFSLLHQATAFARFVAGNSHRSYPAVWTTMHTMPIDAGYLLFLSDGWARLAEMLGFEEAAIVAGSVH